MILKDNYEGLTSRRGTALLGKIRVLRVEQPSQAEKISKVGKNQNISFFAELSKRDGQMAKEQGLHGRSRFAALCCGLRSLLRDTSFDNRHNGSPWGQFTLGYDVCDFGFVKTEQL